MVRESDETVLDNLLMRWEELHEGEQTATIESLCAERPDLIEELRRRVDALRKMEPLFEPGAGSTRARNSGTTRLSSEPKREPSSGRRSAACSANFRDLRFHAAGGLGEVFMARGDDLHREVALKFVKRLRARDPESRRQFLQEAEITGRLEHPGVVPVYSLGQDDDGNPCYAMRFIRGETLEDEIRRFHEIGGGPSERSPGLRLLIRRLITVCNTIAYAHSRGVLHRDIKPKNIMLGKYDETLVVDWGLARAFERGDDARHTGEETLAPSSGSEGSGTPELGPVGTPAYMSPEQAENDWQTMGPSSDVYSLGATLYTILTGQPPVSGRSIREVLDRVCHGEFSPPAQVNRAVPLALDAICRKAMSLDRRVRYPDALALADDLDRWLADEPVSARRDPWTIRLGRWARRHRTTVVALATLAAATVVASVVIAVVTDLQKQEIQRQKVQTETNFRRADANFQVASEAVDTMLARVGEVDLAEIPQMEAVRRDLLTEALGFTERLAQHQDNTMPPLMKARASRRVGDIQAMLGNHAEAESAFVKAIDLLKPLAAGADEEARSELARAELGLGILEKTLSRFDKAKTALDHALKLREGLATRFPESPEHKKALAEARYQRGALLARMPNAPLEEVEQAYKEAREALLSLRTDPANPDLDVPSALARQENNLAMLQNATGRVKDATDSLRSAKKIQVELVQKAPDVTGHRWRLARTCNNLAVALMQDPARRAEAGDDAQKAFDLLKPLAYQFPRIPDYADELAEIETNLGQLLSRRNTEADHARADEYYRNALKRRQSLADRFKDVPRYRIGLARLHLNRGSLLEQTDPKEALSSFNQAREIQEDLIKDFKAQVETLPGFQDEMGRTLFFLARIPRDSGNFTAARRLFSEAVEHHRAAFRANPRNTAFAGRLHQTIKALAESCLSQSDLPAASKTIEELPDLFPENVEDYLYASRLISQCLVLEREAQHLDQAERYAQRAIKLLQTLVDRKLVSEPAPILETIKKIELYLKYGPPKSG